MANRTTVIRKFARRAILIAAGTVCLSAPIVASMIDAPVVNAQSARGPDAKTPKFEVASIKRSLDHSFTGMDLHAGGRLTANAPLAVLVANAYNVKPFQIAGGPAWMYSDLYKVEATMGANASAKETLIALQGLLQERFNLHIQRKTSEIGVYVLGLGKSGLKRERQAGRCAAPDLTQPPLSPQPSQPPCGIIMMTASVGTVRLQGREVSVADFLDRLSNFVDRPIIDRTGYTGKLDVDLEFAPDRLGFVRLGGVVIPGESTATTPDENSALSLFTAIRERLGLKLESGKAPGEVLMIEHVQRPSAN